MPDLIKWLFIVLGVVLISSWLTHREPPAQKPTPPPPKVIITPKPTPVEPSVLTVNGQAISQREFAQAFEEVLAQQRQLYAQFGQDFDEVLKGAEGAYLLLRLKGEAAEELIRQALQEQAAAQLGVKVSDVQIAERFQQEYQRILDFYRQRNGWSEQDISDRLREEGSSLEEFQQRIRELVAETLKQEALQAAVAGEIPLDDAALLAYLEKNSARYTAEAIRPFSPTDHELRAFWEKHQDQYGQVRVRVRHILIRVAQDAPEDQVEAAQAKIAEIQQKLAEGADFAQLARDHSEDPGSRERGGDLGFIDATMPYIKEFKEAALPLETGQVSEPVRTRLGFHLIKADAREEQTLENIREQLQQGFQSERETESLRDWIARAKAGQTGRELIHARFILVTTQAAAEKLAELLVAGEDFEALARAYSEDGATAQDGGDLGWFAAGRFGPEFDEIVAALEVGQVSRVFATPFGSMAVKLEARAPEPSFETVRPRVQQDFLKEERERRFGPWYDQVRADARIQIDDLVLAAHFLERHNKLDEAILAYERLIYQKSVQDSYLAYYLAQVYQTRLAQVQKEKRELAGQPNKQAELEALDQQIDELTALVVKYLIETVQSAGGDADLFETILGLDDSNAWVHYKYGLWLYGEGEVEDAVVQIRRAIDLDPQLTEALVLYGDILRGYHSFGTAAEYYERALALLPKSEAIQRKLAEAYVGATLWEQARELYRTLLEKHPEDPALLAALGEVSFGAGDWDAAETFFIEAIAKDPQTSYQLKLANLYLTANRAREAQGLYVEILESSPDEVDAYLGLGQAYELQEMRAEALQAYLTGYEKAGLRSLWEELGEKILALDPDRLEIRLELAESYQAQHRFEEAIAHYQAILERHPTDRQQSRALFGIGVSRRGQAEYAMAKEAFLAALAVTEDERQRVGILKELLEVERVIIGVGQPLSELGLDALHELAVLYIKLNQPDEARAALEQLQSENAEHRAEEVAALWAQLEKPQQANLGPDGRPGQPVEILEARQIEPGESHPPYNSVPPTSGWYQSLIAAWDTYEEHIPDEIQVNNLRLGGVLVQYRPDLAPEILRDLTELISQMRAEADACKLILAPYEGLDSAFALTAWGRIDKFDDFDVGRIVQFILAWMDKGPEPTPCP
jgi:parvulin-like peptidyl-prolyl isomerase/Tfp pilus assembly protein PilF